MNHQRHCFSEDSEAVAHFLDFGRESSANPGHPDNENAASPLFIPKDKIDQPRSVRRQQSCQALFTHSYDVARGRVTKDYVLVAA